MTQSKVWFILVVVLIVVGGTYLVVSNALFLRRVRSGRWANEREAKLARRSNGISQGLMYVTFFCAAMALWTR